MNQPQKLFIGIDPGVTTGVAFWDGREILKKFSSTFWGVVATIESLRNEKGLVVVIEDPSQNAPVFPRNLKNMSRDKAYKTMLRIGQNVGSNKREGTLLIEYCEKNGIEYRAVQPTTGKWSAKELKMFTGITSQTNEHVRDAIKLVYGL